MKILTLGEIALDDGSLSQQHQPVILLAYLAFNGPTARRDLATIFWPEAKNPRNSLSSALTRIRQSAAGATIDDPRTVETPLRTDAHDLLSLMEDGDIEGAVRAYRGDFLYGFELRTLGLELEEWIYSTRDRLSSAAKSGAFELMASAIADNRIADAAHWAERVLEITPAELLEDDELQSVFVCLHSAGRTRATQLQAEARLFGRELVVPADEAPTVPPTITSSLPFENSEVPSSGVIGRDVELVELQQKLSANGSANLTGLGGVGKSTLVEALITGNWAKREFGNAVYVIEVDSTDDASATHDKVASAMNLGPVAATVAETFSAVESPTLAVLEDLQPTSELRALVSQLVAVPQLSVLVVSRLRMQVENVPSVQLVGLKSLDSNSPAVELFLERARGQLDEAAIAALDPKEILSICDRLSGIPLAIELAAAWLSIVPVRDISTMLDDPEILESTPPGEHLELGRVIGQTWNLLEGEAQDALRDLAVMDGSFDRGAARSVCEVGLSRLLQLQDHSLLEFLPSGRIRLHALVQAFAASELASNSERNLELVARHQEHFIGQLSSGAQSAGNDDIQGLSADHRNIVGAWRSLIKFQDWQAVEASLGSLDDYLLRSGNLYAAQQLYGEALEGIANGEGQASLVADLRSNLAWVLMLLGRESEASRLSEQGLVDVPEEAVATRIALLRTKCALLFNAGAVEQMLAGYREARDLVEPTDDVRLKALLDEDIGRGLSLLGQNDEAIVAFRSTLDAARSIGDSHMEARSYLLLAKALSSSEPERSLILCDEGEDLAVRHGLRHLQAYFPLDRGFILFDIDSFVDAEKEFGRGLPLAEELGDLLIISGLEFGIARAALRQSDPHRARPHLEQGLRLATRARLWPDALGATLALANFVLFDEPENELARQLFDFCRSHQLLSIEDRRRETEVDVLAPSSPLASDCRLDETCERALHLLRQATSS